jgi:hypothetical protein
LEVKISKAIANGLSKVGSEHLRDLVFEYREIWRISLGAEPPDDLLPMMVELVPGAVPVRVKVRRNPPPQRNFLRKYTAELVKNGQAFRNP